MRLSTAGVSGPGRGQPARPLRPIVVVLASLATALAATACDPLSPSAAAQLITVAAVPGVENANLELAQHDGAFAKAGITVKIERYPTVAREITALNQGSVDVIAADYGDMFFAASQKTGQIYRLLADGYDAAAGVIEIVTLPNSRIRTPAELSGQKVPVPNTDRVSAPTGDPGTLAQAAAMSVLQSDNVNLAAVDWEPMTQQDEIDELIHHQVQAILVSGVDVYLAQQEGAVELIDACSGPTSGIPLDGFFSTAAWLGQAKNAEAAKDFQQAVYNADAAATMPGPIQNILPAWIGRTMSRQEADLVTTGTYPLSTITSSLYRTADLMWSESMTSNEVNVSKMVIP
jgi:NitT/TauT family transport system substrate-binding protein